MLNHQLLLMQCTILANENEQLRLRLELNSDTRNSRCRFAFRKKHSFYYMRIKDGSKVPEFPTPEDLNKIAFVVLL